MIRLDLISEAASCLEALSFDGAISHLKKSRVSSSLGESKQSLFDWFRARAIDFNYDRGALTVSLGMGFGDVGDIISKIRRAGFRKVEVSKIPLKRKVFIFCEQEVYE